MGDLERIAQALDAYDHALVTHVQMCIDYDAGRALGVDLVYTQGALDAAWAWWRQVHADINARNGSSAPTLAPSAPRA